MKRNPLGLNGPQASVQGLGCMGMSIFYGQPDDAASISTIHQALDRGVNLIVTSDAYGNGVNESLLGKALLGRREHALVCTKFGNLALAGGGDTGYTGGHPKHVAIACERSLKRLGVDVIDLYAMHRMDPAVPIEETVGAMKRLVEQGKVRFLGLSEAGPSTIERAHRVHPLVALETEYSLWSRDVEGEILSTCRRLGIALMAYSPLGRGFLTGSIKSLDALGEKRRTPQHASIQRRQFGKECRFAGSIGGEGSSQGGHGCTVGAGLGARPRERCISHPGHQTDALPGAKPDRHRDPFVTPGFD